MTEDDVRRIVREVLAIERAQAKIALSRSLPALVYVPNPDSYTPTGFAGDPTGGGSNLPR